MPSRTDPEAAAVEALFALVDHYKWPCAIAFVAGSYFTLGAALVWSWFL